MSNELKNVKNKNKKFNSKNEYLTNLKSNAEISALNRIKQLELSGIDFTKFGWVELAGKFLNVVPQQVGRLLKKYDPEFYIRNKCFIRKKLLN